MFPKFALEAPLVGRREELDYLDQLRSTGRASAIVLGGAHGVGKTRLAAEVAERAGTDGWAAERVTGTAASRSVPLSAFGPLLPRAAVGAGGPLALLLATVDQLATRAKRHPVLVQVDDAHELDPASIELVRRLAQEPRILPFLTFRTDELVPAPLVTIWKDPPAYRIELQPLARDETDQLVSRLLDGEVAPGILDELWNASLGNPLFLRELVLAYAEQGALRRMSGVWQRCGAARSSLRLGEIIGVKLARLTGDEREVLDTLTVSGPLDLDLLGAVADRTALATVVERGLVQVTELAGKPAADLAHPVYGTVLNEQLSAPRRQAIRQRLLDSVAVPSGTTRATPRSADLVRSTVWRMDEGERVEVDQLLAAAHAAVIGYPYALATRLSNGTAGSGPAFGPARGRCHRQDQDGPLVAERLARAAWRGRQSLPTGLTLATALTALDRTAEAEIILAKIDDAARTAPDRARVAFARASLLSRISGREAEAVAVLAAAEAAVDHGELRDVLARLRATIALDAGHVRQALALATRLLGQQDGDGPVAAMVAATLTAALAVAGRGEEAIATAERYLDLAVAQLDGAPSAAGELMVGRILAERWLGRLSRAEALARYCYEPAAEAGALDAMAVFGGVLGQTLLDQGRVRTAAGWLRESAALLRERDLFGYRPWALTLLAVAAAQTGDSGAAGRAAEEAGAQAAPARYFDCELLVGRAWAQAAAGDRRGAVGTLRRAAETALAAELLVFAAGALHTAVRLGDPRRVAADLASLAPASPLAASYAHHATALAAQDPVALEHVASEFEALGAWLLAAEAAAHATAAHHRRGAPAAALRAAARSRRLACDCEGARTPALQLAVRLPVLTTREHEIAALVAEGMSSRLVADRLTLSVRTVENHLCHIYRKLGLTNRAGLTTLFAPG